MRDQQDTPLDGALTGRTRGLTRCRCPPRGPPQRTRAYPVAVRSNPGSRNGQGKNGVPSRRFVQHMINLGGVGVDSRRRGAEHGASDRSPRRPLSEATKARLRRIPQRMPTKKIDLRSLVGTVRTLLPISHGPKGAPVGFSSVAVGLALRSETRWP